MSLFSSSRGLRSLSSSFRFAGVVVGSVSIIIFTGSETELRSELLCKDGTRVLGLTDRLCSRSWIDVGLRW